MTDALEASPEPSAVQHNHIFSTEATPMSDITFMPQWMGWYDQNHPEQIPELSEQQAWRHTNELEALPPGKRVVFLKWILRYESYQQFGADPLTILENGGTKLSRTIQLLRPFGRELRKRRIALDGIWTDNEGGEKVHRIQIPDERAEAERAIRERLGS